MITYVRIEFYNRQLAKEVVKTFYKPTEEKTNESFFLNKNNYLYVAMDNNQIVGQIYGYVLDRLETSKQKIFIYAVDVVETHRKQGIGRRLIETFLNPFQMGKHTDAFVLTNKENESAIALYLKTGGKKVVHSDGEPLLYQWNLIS